MPPSVLNVPEFDPPSRVRGCGRAEHVPEGARIPQGVRHGDLAGLVSTIRSISLERRGRRGARGGGARGGVRRRRAGRDGGRRRRRRAGGGGRRRRRRDARRARRPAPARAPARRHLQLRRCCWVRAGRAVRSNVAERDIRRAHARPRAPARAGGAPSRPRHALARRERRLGARTQDREQPSLS